MDNDSERVKLLTQFLDQTDDRTGKILFTYKPFLAKFLQLFFPLFKNLTIEEIIKQSIDWQNKNPSFYTFNLSEENNDLDEPDLRQDFVILLRFPDYLQDSDKEKFFILHIEFQKNSIEKQQ